MERDLRITDALSIPERCITWRAVRASGPGGQNVNKVSSKVELRFDLPHCDVLTPAVRARLRTLASNRLDAEGQLLITAQAHRSQPQNLEDARERLADYIRAAMVRPKTRRPTKPTQGSKRRRLEDKRRKAQTKSGRGRVREE